MRRETGGFGPGSARRKWLIGLAIFLAAALPLLYSAVTLPLSPSEQAQVALVMLGVALVAAQKRFLRPLIIFLSAFASVRYFYWRISSTLVLDNSFDASASLALLGAEMYGLLILLLGYFQTIEVTERKPPPVKTRLAVDVFIPTYNEPAPVVRRTVIGAQAMDYAEKQIYLLDDGRRPEMEQMARELGCHYITRPDNSHAKAGNLNHTLRLTRGELIAVFDADHVPVRSFLNKTVGFFEDQRVALVQTAQHFFNPDPYERNLNLTGCVAPEQNFFYHVIQPGNDFWNSAFFCGSCAVLRRSALEAIGGFQTQTVTEDAHTAMELHARGFLSVYLREPLAAGLATETYASHVKQRMRWARGMAQILRIDCPLLKRGLTLPQRLNYFNAMAHFFFGIPRLIMILAPLSFLLLGAHPLKADALAVIAYILPHVGLSAIANSILSKQHRHSFWAGVYEVSIAHYTAGVTLLALLNPRLGKFNVTDKGSLSDRASFDFATSRATLVLIAFSVAALAVAFPLRLILFAMAPVDPSELDAIMINSLWALANLITLVAAACVAFQQPQQREVPRVRRDFRCEVTAGLCSIGARTWDLSESGARVVLDRSTSFPERCQVAIRDGDVCFEAQAERVRCDWNRSGRMEVALRFIDVDAASHRTLVELIFCGDNSWTAQSYPADNLARSFWYLLTTFWRVARQRTAQAPEAPLPTRELLNGTVGEARVRPSRVMLGPMLSVLLVACRTERSGASSGSRMPPPVLEQSWKAYKERFIQSDGRVIDHKAGGISTSEGQAYAMLRAVWVQDRPTFDKAREWARNNLNSRVRSDRLWAWKWGRAADGRWKVLDRAFASDADQDAALALILAYQTWQDEGYVQEARAMLADLWKLGTAEAGGKRCLLAGDSLCQGGSCRLNPSYLAPYAYRIFARFDRGRDWTALIDSSYFLLESVSRLTDTGLPPDWVLLEMPTGRLRLGAEKDSAFSYDAFRTLWRVAMDDVLYREARAQAYLKRSLPWLMAQWETTETLPAIISSRGKPMARWESPEMIAVVMAAARGVSPQVASGMADKLSSSYNRGLWGDQSSYYLQNWAWFGTALYLGYLEPFWRVVAK